MKATGKWILVTGATSGIGRATAVEMARRGWRVIASGRRPGDLERLATEAGVETLELDVTDEQALEKVPERVGELTAGAGIDILVNNAGFGRLAPMEHVTADDLRLQFETNVFGLVRLTQQLLPAMKGKGAGKIINVSSVVGRLSLPMQGIYCATKHAVEAISDAWRVELRPFGISVVMVEPGAIRTNFGSTALAHREHYLSRSPDYQPALASFERLSEKMFARAPGPERVARTIARIASKCRPRARYVVPWQNRVTIFLYKVTPTRWVDALSGHLLGLRRARPGG